MYHSAKLKQQILICWSSTGEETSRWIIVGNSLHKASVLSGLASMLVPAVLPPFNTSPFHLFFQTPTSLLSVACAALYGISWQFDPCCKYQVTVDSNELSNLRIENLTNASPVVLVRRDDKYRKILHNSVAIMSSVILMRTVNAVWNEISWSVFSWSYTLCSQIWIGKRSFRPTPRFCVQPGVYFFLSLKK